VRCHYLNEGVMIFERSRSHLKAEVGRVTASERNRQVWVQVSLSSGVSVFSHEKACKERKDDK
jgi:hypothetical protein